MNLANRLFSRALAASIATSVVVNSSGCAIHPTMIPAVEVSSERFELLECSSLVTEYQKVNQQLLETHNSLVSKANKDMIYMTVGLVFFLPALAGIATTGGSKEMDKIGPLKGEQAAIEKVARVKFCTLPTAPELPVSRPSESPSKMYF